MLHIKISHKLLKSMQTVFLTLLMLTKVDEKDVTTERNDNRSPAPVTIEPRIAVFNLYLHSKSLVMSPSGYREVDDYSKVTHQRITQLKDGVGMRLNPTVNLFGCKTWPLNPQPLLPSSM